MIARGFKPVAWVAAVGGAALGCYMLSLNVASERAELAAVERQIIMAKRDIRDLHTELGTRGRLTQLEHWNAEVLALSAPASKQFLQDEFRLASFAEPRPDLDENAAKVRLASAQVVETQAASKPAIATSFEAPPVSGKPLIRKASLVIGEVPAPLKAAAKPVAAKSSVKKIQETRPAVAKPAKVAAAPDKKTLPERQAGLIDSKLVEELGAASKAENKAGAAAR